MRPIALVLALTLWPGQGWPQITRSVTPADGYQRLTITVEGASSLGLLVTPLGGTLEGARLEASANVSCVSVAVASEPGAAIDSLACGLWLQATPDDPIPGVATLALDAPPDVQALRVQYERPSGAQYVETWLLPEGTIVQHWQYLPGVTT